jgi:hypothetical protein
LTVVGREFAIALSERGQHFIGMRQVKPVDQQTVHSQISLIFLDGIRHELGDSHPKIGPNRDDRLQSNSITLPQGFD